MDSASVTAASGLLAAMVAVAGLLWGIGSSIRKNQVKAADALNARFSDGIKEGERRMESKIDRLTAQLELRTSERDQARSELGESRNDHRDRRGRD